MKIILKLLALISFAVWTPLFYGCKDSANSPVVFTTEVSEITSTTAVTGGTVTDNGGAEVTQRGCCWSTSEFPTTDDNKTSDGDGVGSFTSNLEQLTPGVKYYVRAYAINSAGTAYGNQISFTTPGLALLPTLTTADVTSIASTTAVSGGNITSDGGATINEKGVVWGTAAEPTISNNRIIDYSASDSYISVLNGLSPGTTYYLRAYASNSAGTAYGNQLIFITTIAVSGGIWTQKSDFPGEGRYSATSFSIGTKAYLGLGYNQNDNAMHDFWEWDQAGNVWTRKADFPGSIAGLSVGFSIGNKGYVGTGNNNTVSGSTEFWEYDPATNTWAQKASLPTSGRGSAVGFAIGSKGYIGLGAYAVGTNITYYKDFWEWDQATNTWTEKANFGGVVRTGAAGFSIGNKGYICTGSLGTGTTYSREFWEWDQATNAWTKKADFAGPPSAWAVGFSIGNKGYIGFGLGGKDFWEWDQATNAWKEITNFTGSGRGSATGFSIGNRGYVGTGGTGSSSLRDLWELIPE